MSEPPRRLFRRSGSSSGHGAQDSPPVVLSAGRPPSPSLSQVCRQHEAPPSPALSEVPDRAASPPRSGDGHRHATSPSLSDVCGQATTSAAAWAPSSGRPDSPLQPSQSSSRPPQFSPRSQRVIEYEPAASALPQSSSTSLLAGPLDDPKMALLRHLEDLAIKDHVGTDTPELGPHVAIDVEGVAVHWPPANVVGQPMQPQLKLMTQTLRAVRSSGVALLESPTGTGKSLALLCAALAAQRAHAHGMLPPLPPPQPPRPPPPPPPAAPLWEPHEALVAARAAVHDGGDGGGKRQQLDGARPYRRVDALAQPPAAVATPVATTAASQPASAAGDAPRLRIVFTARTHKQLEQSIRQLDRLPGAAGIRMGLLGARKHSCALPRVKAAAQGSSGASGSAVMRAACLKACNKGLCPHWKGLAREEHAVALHRRCCGPEATPFTLEDLGALAQLPQADGKPAGGCAFFSSRVLLGNAELIFAPYSYVIDAEVGGLKMRELLEDSLLIFDEAHNVEDAAREAGSIELPGHEAANLLRLLEKLRGLCSSDPALAADFERAHGRGVGELQVRALLAATAVLKEVIRLAASSCNDEVASRRRTETQGAGGEPVAQWSRAYREQATGMWQQWGAATSRRAAEPTKEPMSMLAQRLQGSLSAVAASTLDDGGAEYVPEQMLGAASEVARELVEQLQPSDYSIKLDGVTAPELACARLQTFVGRVRQLLAAPDAYHVAVLQQPGTRDWSLGMWLMTPALVLAPLFERCRAVVLASATLSPLKPLAAELLSGPGTAPPPPLHCEAVDRHVVDPRSQVWCGCCSHTRRMQIRGTFNSPTGVAQPRDATGRPCSWAQSESFADLLGEALQALLAAIPAGVIVFMPSYATLERAVERWRATGVWAALQLLKPCLNTEAAGRAPGADTKTVVATLMADHKASVAAGRGACLLGVYRGALSEGMSFDDDDCRGVICVGIPLPNSNEPKLAAKKVYNNALLAQQRAAHADVSVLDGESYYLQQGWRALNQALGRAIRHPRDYGALVLLDERHSHPENNHHLPAWLRRNGLRTPAAPVPTEASEVASSLRAFFIAARSRYGSRP